MVTMGTAHILHYYYLVAVSWRPCLNLVHLFVSLQIKISISFKKNGGGGGSPLLSEPIGKCYEILPFELQPCGYKPQTGESEVKLEPCSLWQRRSRQAEAVTLTAALEHRPEWDAVHAMKYLNWVPPSLDVCLFVSLLNV